jgi:hypothetical protein
MPATGRADDGVPAVQTGTDAAPAAVVTVDPAPASTDGAAATPPADAPPADTSPADAPPVSDAAAAPAPEPTTSATTPVVTADPQAQQPVPANSTAGGASTTDTILTTPLAAATAPPVASIAPAVITVPAAPADPPAPPAETVAAPTDVVVAVENVTVIEASGDDASHSAWRPAAPPAELAPKALPALEPTTPPAHVAAAPPQARTAATQAPVERAEARVLPLPLLFVDARARLEANAGGSRVLLVAPGARARCATAAKSDEREVTPAAAPPVAVARVTPQSDGDAAARSGDRPPSSPSPAGVNPPVGTLVAAAADLSPPWASSSLVRSSEKRRRVLARRGRGRPG